MGKEVNGVSRSRFEMFTNSDEAVINKKLPKELLLRIFSFLDVVTLCRCAQVSRSWNVLALDGSNWQRIDLFDFQRDIEGRVVENISKRCGGFLRKLSLRGCLGVGDSALRTFSQNCRNIELLSLNGCTKITDSTCNSLSKFCPKLKHLDLSSCTSITNLSLKALSEGCPLLEQLNISWCDQVTKDGVQALVRSCPGIKGLFLKGCTQLEDEALKHIGAHCPELVTLNLQTCSLFLISHLRNSPSRLVPAVPPLCYTDHRRGPHHNLQRLSPPAVSVCVGLCQHHRRHPPRPGTELPPPQNIRSSPLLPAYRCGFYYISKELSRA
uniref:F-box and leucine rich repeat protein 20 n=1 Tax=Scophthalmus maximus TaxID=52904 RepID=A0A8D3ABB6_SCOMX